MSMKITGSILLRNLAPALALCLAACRAPEGKFQSVVDPPEQQPAAQQPAPLQPTGQPPVTATSPAARPTNAPVSTQTSGVLSSAPEAVTLREGDIIRIDFPGAPNLNTRQQIARDGKISLPLVGDVVAVGKTPRQLADELKTLFAPQLVTKEVNVSIESSVLQFSVTGAVLRPGPYTSSRPISVLEAIMQAGGFDETRANKASVRVLREGVKPFEINLKRILKEGDLHPFYLKPGDTVYVPERFRWF